MRGHITPLAFTQVPSEQQHNEEKQEKKSCFALLQLTQAFHGAPTCFLVIDFVSQIENRRSCTEKLSKVLTDACEKAINKTGMKQNLRVLKGQYQNNAVTVDPSAPFNSELLGFGVKNVC